MNGENNVSSHWEGREALHTPIVESSDLTHLTSNKRSTTTTPNTYHSDEHQEHNMTYNY